MTTAAVAALVVRYGLVLLFLPFSALDKIFGFDHAVKQAQSMFKPHPIAVAMILIGLFVEVVCTLGVVTGVADRLCAFVIARYCAATAVLYKQFWAQGDFWSDPDGEGRTLLWDFLKNSVAWRGPPADRRRHRRDGARRVSACPLRLQPPVRSHS